MKISKVSPPTRRKVLGIDPGYERLGVAVVENNGVLFSDCLRAPKSLAFGQRLVRLGTEFAKLLDQTRPDAVAIERLFVTKNQKTASRVAELRGVLVYETAKRGLPLIEFTPGQIKVAITGSGRADKAQVAAMVRRLVVLDERKRLDDEYDAIAIGLTALAHQKIIHTSP